MSRWSPRNGLDWIADRRAQTEPIAALVAVLAIGVGLALYAGVAVDRQPEQDGTDAEATMQRIEAGVLEDGLLLYNESIGPERYERPGETVSITIECDDSNWWINGDAPSGADSASRPVTVEGRRGVQKPCRLTVEVWES